MSGCPRYSRCECCGREVDGVTMVVTDSPVGPFCVSACPTCMAAIENGTAPPVSLGTAIRLAEQHRAHDEP